MHCFYLKGKSLSLICGAVKWLLDSEEREKVKVEAVLAGKLPPSVLDEVAVANGNHASSSAAAADAQSTPVTQGTDICDRCYSAVYFFKA